MKRPPDATTLARGPEASADTHELPALYARVAYTEGLTPLAPLIDRVLPFERERPSWVLGRAPAAADDRERALPLPFDAWASRSHARLRLLATSDGQGLIIEDLGSRNGTFVNATPVQGRVLARVGDVVRVGSTLLVVGSAPIERARSIRAASPPPPGLEMRSWCMLEVWERLTRLAQSPAGVLLLGEMGTGKTRLARWLHKVGPRAEEPFVAFNCSAIPKDLEEATLFGVVGGFIPTVREKRGWITLAGRGTLFLDELADLPAQAQAKLLDAFDPTEPSYAPVGATQRLTTRCRLVSATNRDVFALAAQGVVRQDLLSRLVAAQVTVPPLRDRREDILPIFGAAVERAGGAPRSEWALPNAEVTEALLAATWTENARGLESLAAQVALGEPMTSHSVREHANRGVPGTQAQAPAPQPPAAAPVPGRPDPPEPPPAWPPTAREQLALLAAHDWKVKDAAGTLGKRPETLSRLLSSTFGGRPAAQRAERVLRASGRLPAKDQIEPLFDLFCRQPETPDVLAARARWRDSGAAP